MLVLSRKKDEALIVGEARIVVIDIRGDKVRLGVECPKEVPVHREEVWEAIRHGELREISPPSAVPPPVPPPPQS